MSTYRWKDLYMDFVISLSLFLNRKNNNYDAILVIIDCLTKIIHYKPIKTTIDAICLAEVIIDMVIIVIRHHCLLKLIINDQDSLFTLKFWSLLCYFLSIKQRLSTTFYLQMNDQIKRENSKIKIYIYVFVNWL